MLPWVLVQAPNLEPFKLYFTFLLTSWFVLSNVDETENVTNVLFTVPLQVLTIADEIKPFQTGSVFTVF